MISKYKKNELVGCSYNERIIGSTINRYKEELIQKIKNLAPKKGDTIVPKIGTFKSLKGKVLSISRDRMTVTAVFEMSSRIVEAPVSVLNIESEIF